MKKESIKKRYKDAILKAVAYHFDDKAKVILFGSRARRTHEEGADVDLAIDIGKRIPLYELSRLRGTFENLPIPLEVDVVDMKGISPEFKKLILKEGEVWIE